MTQDTDPVEELLEKIGRRAERVSAVELGQLRSVLTRARERGDGSFAIESIPQPVRAVLGHYGQGLCEDGTLDDPLTGVETPVFIFPSLIEAKMDHTQPVSSA